VIRSGYALPAEIFEEFEKRFNLKLIVGILRMKMDISILWIERRML
jgi:hypothetical protein